MRGTALRRFLRSSVATADGSAAPCSTSGRADAAERRYSALSCGVLVAEARPESGSQAATRLRKVGRTPGVLFSLPGEEQLLLSFDAKAIATQVLKLGRTGWACSVWDVEVTDPAAGSEAKRYRALGRQVHLTATTDAIENVTLLHCPPERAVRVSVPLTVLGEEVCPAIKAGGRINWIRRTVPCVARGDAVPMSFEIDISQLQLKEKLHYRDLNLPEGVELAVKDVDLPLIKMSK